MLKLYDIYTCDFYGSNLRDCINSDVQKLLNSCNIAIRILFDVPQEKPIDISLSPFLMFLILKQFYALVLYNL